jgi:cobalt-zinc-cadmium efflux system outer membrane protein
MEGMQVNAMLSLGTLLIYVNSAGNLFAQTRLTLQDAISQALQNNPQVQVAQSRTEAAIGQRTQAGLKPNPRLFVQSEDVRAWGTPAAPYWQGTEEYVYLGQVFETAGKRQHRVDVASSDVRSSEVGKTLQYRQIVARIGASYWTATGAAALRDLYTQTLRTYDEDYTYSQNRVQEGVMAEADLLRLQLERDLVRAQASGAVRDAELAVLELFRAMGRSDHPLNLVTDSLGEPPDVNAPPTKDAVAARLEDSIAREQIARAEQNVRLQKANGKPDPEFYLGYKRNTGQDTLFAAVQLDIPIRNRNQGNIGTAQADLRSAEANLKVVEVNLSTDFEAAKRAYETDRDLLRQYSGTRLVATRTEALARGAYREGGIDLIRLLDAERSRISVEMQYIRALVELRQSIVNLQLASGMEIRP